MSQLVFVYGSLQRGLLHHEQLSGAEFVGEALLSGHALVLYEDAYPALFRDPASTDPVRGELFSVTTEKLAGLDRFEDVPELYQRVRVRVTDGREAWAYAIDVAVALRYPRIVGPWRGLPPFHEDAT